MWAWRTGHTLGSLVMCAASGCGGGGLPAPETSLRYKLDDPDSIARWEASEENYALCKVVVAELRYFGEELGGPSPHKPTPMAIYVEQARDSGIAPEQQDLIDALVEDEAMYHALVRDAVYKEYVESYDTIIRSLELAGVLFGLAQTDIAEMAPKIVVGDELDSIMNLSISVHPVVDGTCSIGVLLTTPWSDNDMGLRIEGGGIAAIGTAYESFPPLGEQ